MRALKALVIGMGVLIAAGLGIVVYAVADRVRAPEGAPPPVAQPAGPAPEKKTVRELRITLPAGAEIVDSRISGGQLMLRLKRPDGVESIEIFDTETGRRLRRLTIDRAQ